MIAKTLLLIYLDEAEFFVERDFQTTPDDLFTQSIGGKARPAAQFMAEVGLFNSYVAAIIKDPTIPAPTPETEHAKLTKITTKDQAHKFVKRGFTSLRNAIQTLDEEALLKPVTAPWGEELALGAMILHAIGHTMYHDGQLNLVQLISGDDTFHWAESPELI
jgi:hypothetical protein